MRVNMAHKSVISGKIPVDFPFIREFTQIEKCCRLVTPP
jgi:hypothetical protein